MMLIIRKLTVIMHGLLCKHTSHHNCNQHKFPSSTTPSLNNTDYIIVCMGCNISNLIGCQS